MRVAIFGTGYVGLVTGACLADTGNHVLCVDIDEAKVERLNRGEVPIYEPGLGQLFERTTAAGRLKFTTDVRAGVAHGVFQFIAVGTPPGEDGSADLSHVVKVAQSIGEQIADYRVVVTKSTVPVGTVDLVKAEIDRVLAERGLKIDFDVVSNPEFLKEGAAVEDFMKPDRIIVGTSSHRAVELISALYEPYNRNHDRVIVMDERSAELTKYAANAMLATKISFMNELANLAERVGADIEQVRVGIGSDPRIGYSFIYPGCGYGGSCFPKDVKALAVSASSNGYRAQILEAVDQVNDRQKEVLFGKIERHFGGKPNLKGKVIALWGLAFKPNTDDMREAPSRALMEALWMSGARVQAYDPVSTREARHLYGDRADLTLCERADDALAGADALAIVTEWHEFRSPDFEAVKAALREPVIFDGRNLYDPKLLAQQGIRYYAIGRGLPAR
jgi:UDPglucose 6-dehydrogenase